MKDKVYFPDKEWNYYGYNDQDRHLDNLEHSLVFQREDII